MGAKWHETCKDRVLTVSRRVPARFDVSVDALFPPLRPSRLALQIRQDMWRRLQKVRGFSPVVQITEVEAGLLIVAGGQIDGTFPKAYVEAQIADLLADRARRDRWIRYARRKERKDA